MQIATLKFGVFGCIRVTFCSILVLFRLDGLWNLCTLFIFSKSRLVKVVVNILSPCSTHIHQPLSGKFSPQSVLAVALQSVLL